MNAGNFSLNPYKTMVVIPDATPDLHLVLNPPYLVLRFATKWLGRVGSFVGESKP